MTELMISSLNPFHSYFKVGRHERHSGPSLTFHTVCRCAQSPRSNVSVNTPPLVDSSRASHLDLFEQPGIRVFQQRDKYPLKFPAAKPLSEFIIFVHGSASGFEQEETLIAAG